MSQTWFPNTSGELDSDNTLSDSRGYINDALKALRSSWSGATAPSSPVAGQFWIDTDDDVLRIWNGSAWVIVGDADVHYMGALAREGGATYAMGGDLYMGTHQIRGMTDPTISTDGATKHYVDTYAALTTGATFTGDITMGANNITMDHNPTLSTHLVRKAYVDLFEPLAGAAWTANHPAGGYKLTGLGTPTAAADAATKSYIDGLLDVSSGHRHKVAEGSRAVLWTDLSAIGATALATNLVAGTAIAGAAYATSVLIGESGYTTVITSSAITVTAGAKVLIVGMASLSGGGCQYKLQRIDGGTTDIIAEITLGSSYAFSTAYIDTVPGAGTYSYRIVMKTETDVGNRGVFTPSIFALEVI